MTRFGTPDNTNASSTFTGPSGSLYYFVGGEISEGGTLDTFYFYAADRGAFTDFDWAIYAGGDSGGPDGASLIWESADYQGASFTTDWQSESASGSFSAGWIWIVLRSNDGITLSLVDDADAGDLDATLDTSSETGSSGPGTTWDDPFSGDGTSGVVENMKVAFDYTAASSGSHLTFQPTGGSGGMADMTGGING